MKTCAFFLGRALARLSAVFAVVVSAHAQFTLQIVPISPGTGAITFTLEPGFFYSVDSTPSLAAPVTPMSGWMLGNGTLVTWPIHYPTSPASSGGGSGITAIGDTFTIYSFDNGKSLVTWDASGGTLSRALIAQDFSTLPPLLTLPGSQTTPYLALLLGNLAWDPAYDTLDPALLTTAQQTTLARLTSRYADVLAAASGGSGGPGVVIDSPKHFFRLRRVEIDQDHDGLSFAQEVLVYGSDPNNADTDGDGISDGEEVARGLNPGSDDSDGDTVKDGSDAYPNDGRRSEDIPVKFYGVIDLTQYLSPGNPFLLERADGLLLALDDENRVAFGGLVQHPPADESTLRTVVWKDGAIERDTTLEFPYAPSVPVPSGNGVTLSFHRHTWPDAFGLNAQGVVEGFGSVQIIENYDPPDTDYMWQARFSAGTSLQIRPLAHSSYPPPPYPLWGSVMFSPRGTAFYVETAAVGGPEVSTPIFGTTPFTAFQSTRWSGNETAPSQAVASSEDDLVWKLVSSDSSQPATILLYDHTTGTNTTVSNIPSYATLLAMNSSKQVVGDLHTYEPQDAQHANGRGWLGFLWKDGTMQTFHDLLPAEYRNQIRSAVPFMISNHDDDAHSVSCKFSAETLIEGSGGATWTPVLMELTQPDSGEASVRLIWTTDGDASNGSGMLPKVAAENALQVMVGTRVNPDQSLVGTLLVKNGFQAKDAYLGIDPPTNGDKDKDGNFDGPTTPWFTSVSRDPSAPGNSHSNIQLALAKEKVKPAKYAVVVATAPGQPANLIKIAGTNRVDVTSPKFDLQIAGPGDGANVRSSGLLELRALKGNGQPHQGAAQATLKVDVMPQRIIKIGVYYLKERDGSVPDVPAAYRIPDAIRDY